MFPALSLVSLAPGNVVDSSSELDGRNHSRKVVRKQYHLLVVMNAYVLLPDGIVGKLLPSLSI